MKNNYHFKFILSLIAVVCFSTVWAQDAVFGYTGSAETYVVPPGVSSIEIEVSGAEGGDGAGCVGGLGATMIGAFDVTPGATLTIVVGEAGTYQYNSGGGGGGTGVILDGVPLIIAGGGGGGSSNGINGHDGLVTEAGGNSSGPGGTDGNGGQKGFRTGDCGWASGGGGFYGDGYGGSGVWDGGPLPGTLGGSGAGKSWASGGAGGSNGGCTFAYPNEGGWGCGGGGSGSHGAGGGGGYSGGGGGQYVDPTSGNRSGGGGGSFNDGTDQVNTPGNHSGHGEVKITILCSGLTTDIPVTGVCLGEEVTLYAESETGGVITWDGGVLNGEAFVPGPGTTTYTATSSSDSDCNFSVDISASPVPDIIGYSSSPTACEGTLVTLWGEGGDTYDWTGDADIDPEDSVAFIAEEGTVTYTLVGSILGCEGEPYEVVLVGAPQPDVVATATPSEVCVGTEYILTGSGASVYNWGGGIEDGDAILPVAAGVYVHTLIGVSDDGCGDTTSVSVIVNALPIVNAGMDVTQCEGLNVTLNATGAGTYSWSPAITNGVPFPAEPGETTYTVTGSNAKGCEATDEVVVTGVLQPVITAVVTDEYALYTGSIDVTVTGGSGTFSYSWSHGPTTQDVYGLTGGLYEVIVNDVGVDDDVCPSVDSLFIIKRYVSVDELSKSNLLIYPNPTDENILISLDGSFEYKIYSVQGELILSGNGNGKEEISLLNVASGTYIIEVLFENEIFSSQIIKN